MTDLQKDEIEISPEMMMEARLILAQFDPENDLTEHLLMTLCGLFLRGAARGDCALRKSA